MLCTENVKFKWSHSGINDCLTTERSPTRPMSDVYMIQ